MDTEERLARIEEILENLIAYARRTKIGRMILREAKIE